MANPIKETPILTGKDARIFLAKISCPNKKDAITDAKRQRMREGFERINAMVVIR